MNRETDYHGYKGHFDEKRKKKNVYEDNEEVSKCIREFISKGKSQEQAVAACLEIERQK